MVLTGPWLGRPAGATVDGMTISRVLVTGGSGFIAGHVVQQLRDRGHEVRTTSRSTGLDLRGDAGWADAVAGCDAVVHVASPVLPGHVEDEDDVIVPARDGTLRVLGAARDAGVRRVVLTSAFHAVGWGHPHTDHVFTEADWTVLDGPGADAYARAKTIAERAAWDLLEGSATELVTVLPVAVMGPVSGNAVSGANRIVERLLAGAMPGLPNLWIPIVDVRDVAAAHVSALTTPAAAGQRFLIAGDPAVPMRRIAAILREHLGDAAARVPTREIPDEAVRAAAATDPAARAMVGDLGYARRVSGERARRVLGCTPRPAEESVVAAAVSLLERGAVTPVS